MAKKIYKCDNCGVEFMRYESEMKSPNHYCSLACYNEARPIAIYTCEYCGKEYTKSVNKGKRTRFCSAKCMYAGMKAERNPNNTICAYCGKPFHVSPSAFQNGEGKYCSNRCRGLDHRIDLNRETNGHWYDRRTWREIRELILKRDNYTCTKCGATDKQLHVHHLIRRKARGGENPENLTTLCRTCHAIEDAKQFRELGLKRIRH